MSVIAADGVITARVGAGWVIVADVLTTDVAGALAMGAAVAAMGAGSAGVDEHATLAATSPMTIRATQSLLKARCIALLYHNPKRFAFLGHFA